MCKVANTRQTTDRYFFKITLQIGPCQWSGWRSTANKEPGLLWIGHIFRGSGPPFRLTWLTHGPVKAIRFQVTVMVTSQFQPAHTWTNHAANSVAEVLELKVHGKDWLSTVTSNQHLGQVWRQSTDHPPSPPPIHGHGWVATGPSRLLAEGTYYRLLSTRPPTSQAESFHLVHHEQTEMHPVLPLSRVGHSHKAIMC